MSWNSKKRCSAGSSILSGSVQCNMETKKALQELAEDLEKSRREYARSTMHITQLDTLIAQLRESDAKKEDTIQRLEAELAELRTCHQQEVELLTEEYQTKEAALTHTLEQCQVELRKLSEENMQSEGYDADCRYLRETVLDLQSKLERLQRVHEDLSERFKKEKNSYRGELEEEYRKRLAESEKRFRTQLYLALSEETKSALQGNDELQNVLVRQNESIQSIINRCRELEQQHMKMQVERESHQQNCRTLKQKVESLDKQLKETTRDNVVLKETLDQRRAERASLELLFLEYDAIQKQLHVARSTMQRQAKEIRMWKSQTRVQSPPRRTQEVLDPLLAETFSHPTGRGAGRMHARYPPTHKNSNRQLTATELDRTITPLPDSYADTAEHPECAAEWEDSFDSLLGADPCDTFDHKTHTSEARHGIPARDALRIWRKSLDHSETRNGPPLVCGPENRLDEQLQEVSHNGLTETFGEGARLRIPLGPVRPRSKITVAEERRVHERNLSVLSHRKFKTVPTALRNMKLPERDRIPLNPNELNVVKDFSSSKFQFLVP